MKYYEVKFLINSQQSPLGSKLSPLTDHLQDARDLLAALAGETGFETFEESEGGLTGYVQQQLFDRETLDTLLTDFPMPGITVSYTVGEAEDRDWNEQWEQEGFEPIIVRGQEVSGAGQAASDDGNAPTVIIHDGRHLPETRNLKTIEIEIDAHLAFGTGTHETTRMVCAELINYFTLVGNAAIERNLPIRVLDCGTGTGILAICALKLGAAEAVGYDIDEWAVDNARHNAVINQVDNRFSQLLGDASILNNVEGVFQVVTANINRNILLADLPAFRSKLADGGMLILSGFYTADIPLLVERAAALGLTLLHQRHDNDWACLTLVSRESRG